jgi:4-hydroxy-4-methyl-2-oxoglutarate aldolase
VISDDLIAAASQLGAAALFESAGGGALPRRIARVAGPARLCGRAYTVASPCGDNLLLHHALSDASRGDVLVVDGGGARDVALWGELMTRAARCRGLGGLVMDGWVRDVEAIDALDFPVFAAGTALRGATKKLAERAALGQAVRIGDVTISRGDLVLGDRDGVVVIAAQRAADAVRAALERERRERELARQIAEGISTVVLLELEDLS